MVRPNTNSGHMTSASAYASQRHLQLQSSRLKFFLQLMNIYSKNRKGWLLDLMGSVYLPNWNVCLHCTLFVFGRIRSGSSGGSEGSADPPWPDLVNKVACFRTKCKKKNFFYELARDPVIEESRLRFKIETFYNLLDTFSNQMKERFKDFITVVQKFKVLDLTFFCSEIF